MTAITVPTSTVSPSATRISVTTPAIGDGHLGVDLVGGDLEQRLVGGDRVTDLLEPLRDRALGDGLTELGKRDVSHVCVWCLSDQPLKSRPVSESIVSPNSSDRLG